jgi:hypothetical protein
LIWTAWNNGQHRESGAGYGFKVEAADRDQWFSRGQANVVVDMPGRSGLVSAEVNIKKPSFWGPDCRELIGQAIGRWLISEGYAPWPAGTPPKFEVRRSRAYRFEVTGLAT